MSRRIVLVATLSLAALAAPRAAHASPAVEREIIVGRTPRSYLISVPASWDRRSPIPLLLVFHGSGSDPENMVEATGFDAMAEERHAIVVYPRARRELESFEVNPPAGHASADVLFVDALLERLRARFPLDERRIYATGFSNGASLCYRLAAERPQVFAAIAPVAGFLPSVVRAPPITPVPLLHIHGTADPRVAPPDLQAGPPAPVPTWARWNGCRPEPALSTSRTADGFTLKRADYAGPTPRSDAQLVLFEGVDHDWPGGRLGAASRLVFDFLAAHPRDPPPAPAVIPTPVK
jgi:polyhydroxybutyrate depolymerase